MSLYPTIADCVSEARQEDILEFITKYTATHGYPPSIRDIMHGCYYNSTSSVAHQLDKLKAMGKVEFDPHIARSVRVTG